ncbi:MAG: adenine phosphoribosyltransferase [Alphaproteobacteria bacterium]|nr:adenine phosphoribosyltransferase [Alphaproteobacteria bacterium]
MSIKSRIRTIPNFPKPGIMFRDITTLLQDPVGFRLTIEGLVEPYRGVRVDKVAAIEARGFILGGAVAEKLHAGLVPVRKKGKLPAATISQEYLLEYGTDRIEIHTDSVIEGEHILLIDDLLATGGTASAAIQLLERAGGRVIGCSFVVDLPDLGGSTLLREAGRTVRALCSFDGH